MRLETAYLSQPLVSPLLEIRKPETETTDHEGETSGENSCDSPQLKVYDDQKSDDAFEMIAGEMAVDCQKAEDNATVEDSKQNDEYQQMLREHKAYEAQKAKDAQHRLEILQQKLKEQRHKAEAEAKLVAFQLARLPQINGESIKKDDRKFPTCFSQTSSKTADEELRELEEKLRIDLQNIYLQPLVRRQKNKHDLRYIHRSEGGSECTFDRIREETTVPIRFNELAIEPSPSLHKKHYDSKLTPPQSNSSCGYVEASTPSPLFESQGANPCSARCCEQTVKYGRKNLYLFLNNNNGDNFNTDGNVETSCVHKNIYWSNLESNFIAKEMQYGTQNLWQSDEFLNEKELHPSNEYPSTCSPLNTNDTSYQLHPSNDYPSTCSPLNTNTNDTSYQSNTMTSSSNECSPVENSCNNFNGYSSVSAEGDMRHGKQRQSEQSHVQHHCIQSHVVPEPCEQSLSDQSPSHRESPPSWIGSSPSEYVKRRHKESYSPRLNGCGCSARVGELVLNRNSSLLFFSINVHVVYTVILSFCCESLTIFEYMIEYRT